MKKILTLLGFAAAMSGCVKESVDDGGRIRAGDRLPAFRLVEEAILDADPDDLQVFDSRALDGRKTLIYFFWVGCPDCRITSPNVLNVWTQIDRGDVQLVCIARGGTLDKASQPDAVEYWEGLAPSIAPRAMPPLFYDEDRQVFDLFAEQYVPRFYLADAEGVVRWERADILSADELMRQIDKL